MIYVNIDHGLYTPAVFLDLKKSPFDTVKHDVLVAKLEFYGFCQILLNLPHDLSYFKLIAYMGSPRARF